MSVKVTSFVPKTIKANAEGTQEGMIKVANNVTNQAKSLAPVNKKKGIGGQLRGSIMWKSYNKEAGHERGDKLTSKSSKDEVVVGTNVEYAAYQEYGTRNMEAQPFLRPAVDIVVNGTGAKRAMTKAMYDTVKHHLWREGR